MDIRLQEEKPHQQSDNYEEVEAPCTATLVKVSKEEQLEKPIKQTGETEALNDIRSPVRTGKGSLVKAGAGTIGDREGEQGKGVDIGWKGSKRRDRTAGEMRRSNSRD